MRRRRSTDADIRAVRGAASRVTWQIAAVAAVVVLVVFVLAAAFLIHQSRPSELLEPARPGVTRVYVDASDALTALVVLGALAICVVAVAGWRISRRAVEPLGAALRAQRSFVADASHELRTPLTVLDSRLQLVQRHLARQEPPEEALAAARRDTSTMIDLVTDLLLVAEPSASGLSPVEDCDLSPTLQGAVEDLTLIAGERGVRIELQLSREARVRLSRMNLRRSLVILIDNALRHSPAGSRVLVESRIVRGQASIRIADEGGGITGIDPERVFERFAHGAPTGQRRSFGLGLALARDLVTRAGGQVQVERTSPSGTVMRLDVPIIR